MQNSVNDDDDGNDIDEEETLEGMVLAGGNERIQPILGENWMKRSSSIDFMPAEMTNGNKSGVSDEDESIYMDVGINGNSFGTAELSRRMHEAMMKVATKKYPGGMIPQELVDVYLLYAMDATAKEAVKVAMDSNGYALNLGKDEAMQDEGAWGQIDNVVLLDSTTGQATNGDDGSNSYNSLLDAISKGGWEPGEGYSFVVREVPARKKAMDLEALLRALDPDGTLWDEAKQKGILLPGEEIASLKELAMDCEQRVKTAPFEATDDASVFRGGTSKGYNVISRSALRKKNRNEDGTENDTSEYSYFALFVQKHSCELTSEFDETPTCSFLEPFCSITTCYGFACQPWLFDSGFNRWRYISGRCYYSVKDVGNYLYVLR
jgi:hypothetical protein